MARRQTPGPPRPRDGDRTLAPLSRGTGSDPLSSSQPWGNDRPQRPRGRGEVTDPHGGLHGHGMVTAPLAPLTRGAPTDPQIPSSCEVMTPPHHHPGTPGAATVPGPPHRRGGDRPRWRRGGKEAVARSPPPPAKGAPARSCAFNAAGIPPPPSSGPGSGGVAKMAESGGAEFAAERPSR